MQACEWCGLQFANPLMRRKHQVVCTSRQKPAPDPMWNAAPHPMQQPAPQHQVSEKQRLEGELEQAARDGVVRHQQAEEQAAREEVARLQQEQAARAVREETAAAETARKEMARLQQEHAARAVREEAAAAESATGQQHETSAQHSRGAGARCSGCGTGRVPLRLCSRCKQVSYCTKDCQAWPQLRLSVEC